MTQRSTFTISELADAGGTTPRTVRYYTAEGLLPPPDTRGRYATYSREHLDRLRLIDRLKDARQPLAAIRDRLSRLTAEDVRTLLETTDHPWNPQALDDLLVRCAVAARARSETQADCGLPAHLSAGIGRTDSSRVALVVKSQDAQQELDPESDTWRRIMLAPGVELNVRLPIASDSAERVEELLRTARSLFDVGL